jgi:hypothetical protein
MVYILHQIWEEFETHQIRIHSKEFWLHIMVQPLERGVQVLGECKPRTEGLRFCHSLQRISQVNGQLISTHSKRARIVQTCK